MENILNEQTELSAHTATADMDKGEGQSEVSLGKFKDVGALLSAYNSLQSEFTKRCQKIKELEGALVSADKQSPVETGKEEKEKTADITQKEKDEILRSLW